MGSRLPDFLIIGAMKAGTTTLYADLAAQPSVFMSRVKEPDDLVDPWVETEAGRRRYAKLFLEARPSQACGEASTSYSKLPEVDGVPARAKRLLGRHAKIVYLVRNPVDRIISHHFHMVARHHVDPNIDNVVRSTTRLLEVSRYDMQLKPWLEHFGDDAVCVVRFEDFIRQRADTLMSVCRFLGFEANVELLGENVRRNASSEQMTYSQLTERFISSQFYVRHVSGLFSTGMKSKLRRLLGRGVPRQPASPSVTTVEYLIAELQPSVEELSRMVGMRGLLWDLEATRIRYLGHREVVWGHDRP